MFCARCGAQVSDGARYCPKCGMSVPTVLPRKEGRQLRWVRPLLMGVVAILVIAGVSVAVLLSSGAFEGKEFEGEITIDDPILSYGDTEATMTFSAHGEGSGGWYNVTNFGKKTFATGTLEREGDVYRFSAEEILPSSQGIARQILVSKDMAREMLAAALPDDPEEVESVLQALWEGYGDAEFVIPAGASEGKLEGRWGVRLPKNVQARIFKLFGMDIEFTEKGHGGYTAYSSEAGDDMVRAERVQGFTTQVYTGAPLPFIYLDFNADGSLTVSFSEEIAGLRNGGDGLASLVSLPDEAFQKGITVPDFWERTGEGTYELSLSSIGKAATLSGDRLVESDSAEFEARSEARPSLTVSIRPA